MIVEIIVGIVGLSYVTGDYKRKEKIRKIGRDIVGLSIDVAKDSVSAIKYSVESIKQKTSC